MVDSCLRQSVRWPVDHQQQPAIHRLRSWFVLHLSVIQLWQNSSTTTKTWPCWTTSRHQHQRYAAFVDPFSNVAWYHTWPLLYSLFRVLANLLEHSLQRSQLHRWPGSGDRLRGLGHRECTHFHLFHRQATSLNSVSASFSPWSPTMNLILVKTGLCMYIS